MTPLSQLATFDWLLVLLAALQRVAEIWSTTCDVTERRMQNKITVTTKLDQILHSDYTT